MSNKNRTTKGTTTTPATTTPEWTDETATQYAAELDAALAATAAQEAETAKAAAIAALVARREAVLAELASLTDQLSQVQPHLLDTSVVEKPVALCRRVFAAMYGQGRSKCVRALVAKGVAENTAKTQYQLLHQKYNNGDLALQAEVREAQAPAEAN